MQSSVFFNLEAKHFLTRKITEEKSLASDLLHLCNDSLESLRVVYSEVSENLTVNLDTCLVKSTHQLAVAHTIEASSSVDTLDPQCAECALLVTTIAISVGKTLLPSVLGNGPYVLAGTKITSGQTQDFLSLSS